MLIKPLKWKLFHNNDEMLFLNHRTKWSPPESVAKPWRSQIKPIWTKPWQWVGEKYKTNTAHLPAVNPAALCFCLFGPDKCALWNWRHLESRRLGGLHCRAAGDCATPAGKHRISRLSLLSGLYSKKSVSFKYYNIFIYIYILFSPERPSPRWRSETVSVFSIISFSYLSY